MKGKKDSDSYKHKELLVENNLLGPGLFLTVGPDIINKGEREKHLEPVNPSRPFLSKRKNRAFFCYPAEQSHQDDEQLEIFDQITMEDLNGTITNDKFCLSRTGRLRLSWWRLPLSARETVTQAVEYPSEGTNVERCLREDTHEETAMEGSALRSDKCRRSVSVGSELPVSCPVEHRGSLGPANGTFLSGEAR